MPAQEIHSLLASLAARRPIFHSEADFQHALAWEFHLFRPGAHVRLEKQIAQQGPREHLDLLVQIGERDIAIELKYKTRLLNFTQTGEPYSLRNQSAQDIGRHDFIKDVARLERFVSTRKNCEGFAVVLTNDQTYWTKSKKVNSVDAEFRIHEGRILEVGAEWGAKASDGTKHKRDKPIQLSGKYELAWQNYSSLGTSSAHQFRYALLRIPSAA